MRARTLSVLAMAGASSCSGSTPTPLHEDSGSPASPVPGSVVLKSGSDTQDFGAVPLGQSSPSVRISIVNLGSAASGRLTGATVTGPDASSFPTAGDACTGMSLMPHARCSVILRFAPTGEGVKNAVLVVADDLGNMASVALAGDGVTSAPVSMGAAFEIAPAS